MIRILFIFAVITGCSVSSHDLADREAGVAVPTVYKRYLQAPEPAAGIEAQFNPPVLRWPRVQGKQVAYDVRLSRDSLFTAEGVIEVAQHPWAMFNPHQKLAPGTWYWQYRVSDDRWSAVQHFTVADDTDILVSPPPIALLKGIPSAHPRVLTDPHTASTLRKQVDSDDARAIIGEADKLLKMPIPGEEDGRPARTSDDAERQRKFEQEASKRLGDFAAKAVTRLAEAYLLTGDGAYRARALEVARRVATWDPDGITSSKQSDFGDARCMVAMALAYDTFYDALTDLEKSTLLKAIHARADRFYRAWVNNLEVRLLSGHVWQHILHYFFNTAQAVHGDDPAADKWLAYAYELFIARTPVLGGKDGGWIEGASYFRMNMEMLLEIPFYIQRYTGFDFVRTHPWYAAQMDWIRYHVPPGSSADGYGDNTEEVYSPGVAYAAYARAFARLTGNREAAWYVQQCERYEKPDYASSALLRWFRLAHTQHLPMPEPQAPAEVMGHVSGEIGMVALHTDPLHTEKNLAVAMRSSPFGCYGHFLADQNSFNLLFRGQRTFFRTGYKIAMTDPHRTGWYQQTKSTNSVLVDGQGQPCSTESYGWIRGFATADRLAYAMGDASHAYASEETREDRGVKRFYRHMVLLKPDILVIYDELEAEHPVRWSWLIHSMAELLVDSEANTFRSNFGFARGAGKLLAPEALTWAVADTFDVPAVNWRGARDASGQLKQYDDEQWHLQATTTPTPATRFLAVLRLGDAPGEPEVRRSDETGEASVAWGAWTITARLDAGGPARLEITDGAGASFDYATGRRAVVTEATDDGKRVTEAEEIIPHDLWQRWLHADPTQTKP